MKNEELLATTFPTGYALRHGAVAKLPWRWCASRRNSVFHTCEKRRGACPRRPRCHANGCLQAPWRACRQDDAIGSETDTRWTAAIAQCHARSNLRLGGSNFCHCGRRSCVDSRAIRLAFPVVQKHRNSFLGSRVTIIPRCFWTTGNASRQRFNGYGR